MCVHEQMQYALQGGRNRNIGGTILQLGGVVRIQACESTSCV